MNEFIRFNFLSILNIPKEQKNKFGANVVERNEIKRRVRSCEDVKSSDSGSLRPKAGPGPWGLATPCPAGPRGLAVRARPPGLSAASPDTPPTPVALGPACSSRPPLEASGATSSRRLPVSEVGPAPFSAISGTSLLRPSPLRATVCLCVRPSPSLSVGGTVARTAL